MCCAVEQGTRNLKSVYSAFFFLFQEFNSGSATKAHTREGKSGSLPAKCVVEPIARSNALLLIPFDECPTTIVYVTVSVLKSFSSPLQTVSPSTTLFPSFKTTTTTTTTTTTSTTTTSTTSTTSTTKTKTRTLWALSNFPVDSPWSYRLYNLPWRTVNPHYHPPNFPKLSLLSIWFMAPPRPFGLSAETTPPEFGPVRPISRPLANALSPFAQLLDPLF